MRVGTIGTGFITGYILENIAKTDGITCGAVYSRREETGRKLAEKYQVPRVCTDLKEMLSDNSLDFIYIASPNSLHYEQARMALEAGRNVICEKPFTTTTAEAEELIALAREKHLFLLEGITTLYQPGYQRVKEWLAELGDLKMASCTFCQYSSRYGALMAGETPNVFNPAFAGGALMDINLYNIHFLIGLFGEPDRVEYFSGKHANGIDTHGVLILQFGDMICQCTGSKDSWCENSLQILGDKGYIRVTPCSSNCQEVRLVRKNTDDLVFRQEETPWFYEIQGIVDLVNRQDYDTCYRQLEQTLQVVRVLEQARRSAHLPF